MHLGSNDLQVLCLSPQTLFRTIHAMSGTQAMQVHIQSHLSSCSLFKEWTMMAVPIGTLSLYIMKGCMCAFCATRMHGQIASGKSSSKAVAACLYLLSSEMTVAYMAKQAHNSSPQTRLGTDNSRNVWGTDSIRPYAIPSLFLFAFNEPTMMAHCT